ALLQQALETREAALSPDHPEVARTLEALAHVLLEAFDDADGAVEAAERAVRIYASHETADPLDVADARFELARALWAARGLRDRPRASELATQALQAFEQSPGRAAEARAVQAWLAARADENGVQPGAVPRVVP